EQSLIDEGMPESEVKRLCDVHVEVFKQSLEKQKRPQAEPGHPIHTFMLENREAEKILKEIENILEKIGKPPSNKRYKKYKKEMVETVNKLAEIDKHYLRKENQLFPILEKHNVTGPTQVMWAIHDDIRANIKNLKNSLSQDKLSDIITTSKEVSKRVTDMIYKEEHILYPMSLETLNLEEWINVRNGESEIGYVWIKPAKEWSSKQLETKQIQKIPKDDFGKLSLDTGKLTLDQLNLMLTHLPVDLSFVDENDQVAYYSNTPERIFPRSPAVIGRKVQKCHPPKSVHIVEKILKEFKTGKKDVAEFWIQLDGKFIHIRYFAVRDSEEKYIGTLEVSQEITDIKKLEGEKRLLDWS
ncbi:MAG: DUF438 domain-containing protein, partial [Petrotogales bacterium]